MRKSILLFVLFTLTNIPLLLFAQGGYQVTGHIISSEDNEPMIGVSIAEKGTSNGVITDVNGNYSIKVTKSLRHFAVFLHRNENDREAGNCFYSSRFEDGE